MRKLKKFIDRLKRAWDLAKKIKIIRNNATGIDEIWFDRTKKANRGICSSYCRIA